MLTNLKDFYGTKLAAADGDIGKVKDFYFDDKTWMVRYLVVDTGTWLSERQVLLSPHAFGKFDHYEKTLHVKPHKKQIENSPSIESHKPVSRQFEIDYYRYYSWPAYWNGSVKWGSGSYPLVVPPSSGEATARFHARHRDDRQLQSTQAIVGYPIEATDGTIGHVSGFMMDDRSWAIREMVVETGHWYSGREILISPVKIDLISHTEAKVFVNLTKTDIQRTTENHLVHAGAENPGAETYPTE